MVISPCQGFAGDKISCQNVQILDKFPAIGDPAKEKVIIAPCHVNSGKEKVIIIHRHGNPGETKHRDLSIHIVR